jgi:hypothetical protein
MVKGILHILLMSVVIKPLFNGEFSILNFVDFNQTEVEFQQEFVDLINDKKISELEEKCVYILQENGIKNSLVNITCIYNENQSIDIEKIKINLSDSVIISSDMNIDIIDRTKMIICKFVNVSEQQVEVYV